MSSISSVASQSIFQSPRDRLQSELSSEVSSGAISAADGAALSSALSDIHQALSGGSQAAAPAGSGPPDPSTIKAKIDSLIQGEVQSGKLTDSQAQELKDLFAKVHGHHGGHHHAAAPTDASATSGSDPDGDGTDGASTGDSIATDVNTLMSDFLKLLQDATNQKAGYTDKGQTASSQGSDLSKLFSFQT